ncbi:MAG: penicillin-binding protein activator [Proteobacteria bacterium]|nr:penicillin-binding protein activator [Pseudomonadota bacterium]
MISSLLVVAGCPRTKRRVLRPAIPTTGNAEARSRFEQARGQFEREEALAATEFEAIAAEYPDDPIAPWAKLYAGMSALRARQYDQAVAHLESLGRGSHLDQTLRLRGRLYLGLALVYLGEYAGALEHLEAGEQIIDGDVERAEWLAAMAEALGYGDSPLAAIEHYDRWYEIATLSEKSYIAARLRAIVGAADPAQALAAYESLNAFGSPGAAVLGLRVAADLEALGEVERARRILDDTAGARRDAGLVADVPGIGSGGDPDLLGAVLPLTGRRARAGDLAMRGLALASGTFAENRGRDMKPFQLAVHDSASTAQGTRIAIDQSASRSVIAVIGPIDGKSVDVAAAQVHASGLPLLSLNPRSDQRSRTPSPYVFHIVQSAEDRAGALARHAHDKGVREFAVLRPENGYGTAVAGAFRAEVERLGGNVVTEESYRPNTTSFTEVIKRLSEASWEAVFVPDQAVRLELIAPALAAADLVTRPLGKPGRLRHGRKIGLLSTAEFASPGYVRSSGRYSHGAVLAPGFYPDRADSLIGDFTERYELSFGRLPTALDAYAYDAALVVRSAVRSGAATRAQLAERIAAGKVTGMTGTIAFDETHRRADPGLLFTVAKQNQDYAIRAMR